MTHMAFNTRWLYVFHNKHNLLLPHRCYCSYSQHKGGLLRVDMTTNLGQIQWHSYLHRWRFGMHK